MAPFRSQPTYGGQAWYAAPVHPGARGPAGGTVFPSPVGRRGQVAAAGQHEPGDQPGDVGRGGGLPGISCSTTSAQHRGDQRRG